MNIYYNYMILHIAPGSRHPTILHKWLRFLLDDDKPCGIKTCSEQDGAHIVEATRSLVWYH